ncbi:DNA repair protein RadC [Rheinheimera sp. D18]|uniref:JAB domain-containing protein n=1 Tax=Rheinheimera sp. D18 TaxID=2545632 RepID=UPI001045265C|nr:JAB domain-containing protein [Rheinheimera sp. D18]QBL08390.1 DNA repair protein RadC [Rheinheimera sp. D18]
MPILREIDVKYRFKEIDCDITGMPVHQPAAIARLFDYLKYETKEVFIVVNLTKQHDINCFEVVATGSVDAVSLRPAEVLRTAVILNLKVVMLIHNHPSGKTEPSRADINITRHIVEAAKTLDITVLDHIIIGLNQYTSLQETHPDIF